MLLPNIPNSSASHGMWLLPSLFFTICTSFESLICWRSYSEKVAVLPFFHDCATSLLLLMYMAPPPIKSGYHSSSLLCTLTSQAPNLCSPYNFRKRYIASILKNNKTKKHMFGQTSFRLPVQNDHMSEIITDPNLNQLTTHSPPKSKEGKLWDSQALQQIRHGMPRHFTAQNGCGGRKDQRCLFC